MPDNLGPFYQAGRILLAQGKELPRAESYFRKYLTQEPEGGSPDHAAAHWRVGLVLEKLGKKQEAISEIEKAVQMRPSFEDAKKDLKRSNPISVGGPAKWPFKEAAARRCTNYGLAGGPDAKKS